MGLTTAYLLQVKNLKEIFDAIKQAQAPDKFTIKFLEGLGFTSTNDRAVINVLKGLNFLDDSAVPKQRYFDFLDDSISLRILAEGVKEAYADLFRVNNKANELKQEEVKGKLKTLLQGSKGDQVLDKMARTFLALCNLADFSKSSPTVIKPPVIEIEPIKPDVIQPEKVESDTESTKPISKHSKEFNLKYTINIELPSTRDQLVYDAIFKSLRENLL
jgi:hypothetical protein